MSNETMHEVKSAAAILADDVICQSFIQSSSTLAYACLLIRQRKYDLAVHVLHSLEAKQASRFKDMVFYLQAQIGIETGEFATIKRRLVPRVNQHPNDMVALSLLECAIYHEWIEWARSRPHMELKEPRERTDPAAAESDGFAVPTLDQPPVISDSTFGNPQAASAAAYAAAYAAAAPAEEDPSGSHALSHARPVDHFAPSAAPESLAQNQTPLSGLIEVRSASAKPVPAPNPSGIRPASQAASQAVKTAAAASGVRPLVASSGSLEGDVGIYQTLANDQNTQALVIWNAAKGKLKSSCRNPDLETLAGMLPHELPASLQAACAALDGGSIHKICFSFQNLTVTSFHAGSEGMGLLTGHINQSLLSIVRAENTFRKQAAQAAPAPRPAEYAPNE